MGRSIQGRGTRKRNEGGDETGEGVEVEERCSRPAGLAPEGWDTGRLEGALLQPLRQLCDRLCVRSQPPVDGSRVIRGRKENGHPYIGHKDVYGYCLPAAGIVTPVSPFTPS